MERNCPTQHDLGQVSIGEAAVAVILVLAAGWAAGLSGLLAEPMRIVGTWLLLGLAFLIAGTGWMACLSRRPWQWAVVVLMLIVPWSGWTDARHEVLLVVVAAACLADSRHGAVRSMLGSVTLALLLWSLFANLTRWMSAVWRVSERSAEWMGDLVSWLTGNRLWIGPSFAGIELLVLLFFLYTVCLFTASGPRRWRVITALVLVAAIHIGYLSLLAYSLDLTERLPEVAERPYLHPYTPPPWPWSAAIGTLLPWKLPLVAIVLQASLVGLLVRWSRWPIVFPPPAWNGSVCERCTGWVRHPRGAAVLAIVTIAATLAGNLSYGPTDLTGKVILANRQGRLDWRQPVQDRYGRQSAGMFGMLPKLVKSLGGELRVVEQWDETELSAADAVVLLHPITELSSEQRERILDYVRRGGALLVVAEPHLGQGNEFSGHNDLLQDTSISVRRDVVVPMTSGWQHAILASPHPATAGMNRRTNHYFSGAGASLDLHWPARPVIIGRWGWSDPGSDSLFTGVHRWEPGERLGDLVLAAEQRYGRGRILVLGDGHSFTNEGGLRGYWLAGPLLSYLTHGGGNPQSTGRQILALILVSGVAVMLLVWPQSRRVMAVAVLLAVSLAVCQPITRQATRMVPNGRLLADGQDRVASRLAYVGASNAERYSDAPWSFDGIEGLALTLMRHDLLTLSLPRLTRQHLDSAGVYVSLAPSKPFSTRQRRMLVEFVERGGILICTAGAEDSEGSRSLLAEFGIRVPRSPVPTISTDPEPEPMGRMRAIYLQVELDDGSVQDLGVNFFSAWPVEHSGSEEQVIVYGKHDQPLVVLQHFGRGKVVVIGDSGFALNKNLEFFGGEPFDGRYENAHFWRWLLVDLLHDQLWLPPLDAESNAAASRQEGS
jgi:hypothetical protein